MILLEAVILGVVQGVTEIWPISSSAHLVLFPWLFRWDSPLLNSLPFDVALHFGTLLALLWYFRDDLWDMTKCWITKKDSPIRRENRRLGLIVVAATVPGAAAGYFFEKQAEGLFRAPERVAWALIVAGILMAVVDRVRAQRVDLSQMPRRNALWVGCFQALAILPGVSRSGSTLTILRFLQLKRPDAARLSFLLAIPLLGGASVLEARHLLHGGLAPGDGGPLAAGIVASALAGYVTVSAFLRFLRSRSLMDFGIYRVLFGLLVLGAVYLRG